MYECFKVVLKMAVKRRKFNISEVTQRNEVEFGWMVVIATH
jgi:hypothetical protein